MARVGEVFGVQPRIGAGVRGDALVVRSVAGPEIHSGGQDGDTQSGFQRRWEARMPVLVSVPGREPYWLAPRRWMSRAKFPVAGTTLPVTVDPDELSRVRIEWDEVPEIDEWIADGHPVFTDPDSSLAQLRTAMKQFSDAAVGEAITEARKALGATGLRPSSPPPRTGKRRRRRRRPTRWTSSSVWPDFAMPAP